MSQWKSSYYDYLRQMTSGSPNPLGLTGPDAAIEARVQAFMTGYVNYTDDQSNLPAGVVERPNEGPFFDSYDLLEYLDDGGLVIEDNVSQPVVNPLVWVFGQYLEEFDSWVYEVYIDEDISG